MAEAPVDEGKARNSGKCSAGVTDLTATLKSNVRNGGALLASARGMLHYAAIGMRDCEPAAG
jgi:hypothetical protein